MKTIRILIAGFLCLLILSVGGSSNRVGAEDPVAKPATSNAQVILDLTNAARQKQNLPLLKRNQTLAEVALAHSKNMAAQRQMSHELDGKNGEDRVKAAGYRYSWLGENVAVGMNLSARQIFDLWMKSPHHKDNILGEHFEEIGIGTARNSQGEIYYTQVFGTPRKARQQDSNRRPRT